MRYVIIALIAFAAGFLLGFSAGKDVRLPPGSVIHIPK